VRLYAVVHRGYDFEPVILSLWHTREDASAAIVRHYSKPGNEDFPWNGCYVRRIWTNARIHWADVQQ
jgi:hypothetical protein